jgi:hypothetical protein
MLTSIFGVLVKKAKREIFALKKIILYSLKMLTAQVLENLLYLNSLISTQGYYLAFSYEKYMI